ncbi:MAG: Gfo/Idh/MocA family oxidoreductase [Proteobacteria bacterium]|nr:Gfo/Idh/MocA family oxidoreductase [Pseudomonadota bacterium]
MPENSTPGVAVIGGGYWGKNLVRNFHGLGVLRRVCEINPEVRERLRASYPDVEITESPQEVLDDPAVTGVAVSTPAETHGALVRASLLAGKDIFVEKPLCLSLEEGRELVQLADEKKRILMVGHLLWYHPAVLRLKELVDSGALGRILYIYSNRLNMGRLRREENVLWSFAPHDISVILGLLGEMPESIRAEGGNYLHHKISDVTVSQLRFPSGVMAHIFVSWLHPFKEQKLVVVGQEKMAVFDDTVPWGRKLELYSHTITWEGNVPVAHKAPAEVETLEEMEPLRRECEHFLECQATRRTPRTDGLEACQVLAVLNGCQEALETRRESRPASLSTASPQPDYYVHPSAVVDPGATIGPGTKIWHFSHIMAGVRLGARCNLGQNVVVGPEVVIGDGCKIQNNVSVYQGVTLEEDVFCGPSMVFTNVFNPRAHISRKHEFRPTRVGRGATIGANATIICGHTLGRYCFIGAGAVVTRDVPDQALMVGNPARQVGWACICGERLYEDLTCPACGAIYRETPDGLNLESRPD